MDLAIDFLPALAGLLETYFFNLAENEVESITALPLKAALVFALNENFRKHSSSGLPEIHALKGLY